MNLEIVSKDSDIDIVSHKTILKGNFTFGETVKIDGRIEGEIKTVEDSLNSLLIIGENAFLNAKISCNTIIIEGLVRGDIYASEALEIRKTGAFFGNVVAKNIIVHPGGVLEGNCKVTRIN